MLLAKTAESEFAGEYLEDFKVLKAQLDGYFTDLGERQAVLLFDSVELHRIQTYLGGKRTDLNGESIYGQYDLVETLITRSMESIDWLSEKGIDFDRSVVEIPVGALWRRAHKPKRQKA